MNATYAGLDSHRLTFYTEMFDEMQLVLDQARAEGACWSPARCRGILADLRKAIYIGSRRFSQMPYGVWDISFSHLVTSLWDILEECDGEELNVRVQQARLMVDALAPLLKAAEAMGWDGV